MEKVRLVLKRIGQGLCLAGCVWFLLPFLHGGFALGAVFGLCVCLLGFGLLTKYGALVRAGGWKKGIARVVMVLYVLGLVWAGYLSVLIVSVQPVELPKNATVIVLGSQVYSAERMGVSLTNRVQAACDYLKDNPESKVIVTGGQGGDEPCPEALTARNALVKMGIDSQRIFMEDQSTNTLENLEFAKQVAEENELYRLSGWEQVIVTQGFHQYRALALADYVDSPNHVPDPSARRRYYPLMAETDPILLPEYFGRELLSLTKFHLETWPKILTRDSGPVSSVPGAEKGDAP